MEQNKKKTNGTDTKKVDKIATQEKQGIATDVELSDDDLQMASGGRIERQEFGEATAYKAIVQRPSTKILPGHRVDEQEEETEYFNTEREARDWEKKMIKNGWHS